MVDETEFDIMDTDHEERLNDSELKEYDSELALLPCPFCGGEAEIERYGTPRYSTIYNCIKCGCSLETGETFNHGEQWNQRAESKEV